MPAQPIDSAAPVGKEQRTDSIDVLRGFALCGIALINITGFGMPFDSMHDPSVWGGKTGVDLWVWIATELFANGAMFGLFSLLFGAGVILFTSSKGDSLRVADLYYRRTIWLIIFGIVHAYLLLMRGDILYAYGVVALFLFPLRHLRARMLLVGVLAIFMIRGGLAIDNVLGARELQITALSLEHQRDAGADLRDDELDVIIEWEAFLEDHGAPSEESLEAEIAKQDLPYLQAVRAHAPENAWIQSSFMYRTYFWDVLSMMLLGMALFRMRVLDASRSIGFYAGMIALGYGVGIPLRAWLISKAIDTDFKVIPMYELGSAFDLRVFVTIGNAGVVLLVCKLGIARFAQRALASAGRMALTNYVMQTLIFTLVFQGMFLGYFAELSRAQLYPIVLGVWALQLVISPLWLAWFRFGPLEWLWRSLTYWQRQPMRRATVPMPRR